MSDSSSDIKFKSYTDGEPIPPVDPDDIRRTWEYDRTHSRVGTDWREWLKARRAVCSQGTDVDDVSHRCEMIATLATYDKGGLIGPWKHGDELDPAVFRVAATFPLLFLDFKDYGMPGDHVFPFDLNAFVRQLITETGIQHSWKEVQTRIPEGQRKFTRFRAGRSGLPAPSVRDPDTEAKRRTTALLWSIFGRCNRLMSKVQDIYPDRGAKLFAGFVIDNIALVQRVENEFKTRRFPELGTLQEVEEIAARWHY